jgi:hypothetical protein
MEFVEQLRAVQRFLEELEMKESRGKGTESCCTPRCPYCNPTDPNNPGYWQDAVHTGV